MGVSQELARLSKRDLEDLTAASNRLFQVAEVIKSSGVKWAPAAVTLLIEAQEPVDRIAAKGLAAMQRALARRGIGTPAEPSNAEGTHDDPPAAEIVSQRED